MKEADGKCKANRNRGGGPFDLLKPNHRKGASTSLNVAHRRLSDEGSVASLRIFYASEDPLFVVLFAT